MSQSVKTQLKAIADEEFVLMGNTRALLGEIWDHWQKNLGYTPEVARRMMNAAIEEFHRSELAIDKTGSLPKIEAKKAPARKASAKKPMRTAVKTVKKLAGKAKKAASRKK